MTDSQAKSKKQARWRKVEVGIYLGLIILLILSCVLFLWERKSSIHFIEKGYVVDDDVFGNFGDFLSGLLGAFIGIVSVFLLYRTLKLQRITTHTNSVQMEIQRFNELFISLLDIYHEIIKDLKVSEKLADSYTMTDTRAYDNVPQKYLSGKDFFETMMKSMHDKYDPTQRYSANKNRAIRVFNSSIREHTPLLTTYFRTIYRIFGLISSSNIPSEERKKYVKIMRAQLSTGELFFINYNAMTFSGSPSAEIVNLFRITKHLYVFDRLEFKAIAVKLESEQGLKDGLNLVLHRIWKELYEISLGRKKLPNNRLTLDYSTRYPFKIENPNPWRIQITLIIRKKAKNNLPELKGLNKLGDSDINHLIHEFLRLVYVESSYGKFNKMSDVQIKDFDYKTLNEDGDLVFSSVIERRDKKPLRLCHPRWDQEEENIAVTYEFV